MTKKVIIGVIIIIVILGIIGTGSPKGDTTMSEKATSQISKKSEIDTFAEKLGATDKKEAYYPMVGAKDGAKYTLDGNTVEIYAFEKDKLVEGLKLLYRDGGSEVRRIENTVFVFHGYTEDDPALDPIMDRLK